MAKVKLERPKGAVKKLSNIEIARKFVKHNLKELQKKWKEIHDGEAMPEGEAERIAQRATAYATKYLMEPDHKTRDKEIMRGLTQATDTADFRTHNEMIQADKEYFLTLKNTFEVKGKPANLKRYLQMLDQQEHENGTTKFQRFAMEEFKYADNNDRKIYYTYRGKWLITIDPSTQQITVSAIEKSE